MLLALLLVSAVLVSGFALALLDPGWLARLFGRLRLHDRRR